MKLAPFTGVTSIADLRLNRQISRIEIREEFPLVGSDHATFLSPRIQVRMIDVQQGRTTELVPNIPLRDLTEYTVRHEGSAPACVYNFASGVSRAYGHNIYHVPLGQQMDDGRTACVNFSGEKYLDISFTGLNPECTYTVTGVEGYFVTPFTRVYSIMMMQKHDKIMNVKVGENEQLILPVNHIDEVQFYAKNGRSFIVDSDTLKSDAQLSNDVTFYPSVSINGIMYLTGNVSLETIRDWEQSFSRGSQHLHLIPLDDFNEFDVKKSADAPAEFYLVDTKPTV